MSRKQWIILLCIYATYLLLGAAIFFYIESEEEIKRNEEEQQEKDKLEDMIREHFQGNFSTRKHLLSSLSSYCGKPFGNGAEMAYKWDFYHSLFFVITVVSTIGYGNLAPTTMFTRLFMIFYGLIGIPMNGIVIFTMGEYFGKSFTKLHQRWKKSRNDYDYDMAKLGLAGQIVLYLVPGFTFFIFLPSTIMTVFEGWEYDVSVYYSFVSLTTIGFGDYVAGAVKSPYFGSYYSFYKFFLLVWIIGGMGYLAMVLSFITRGMRSKKVKVIERILIENFKNTPKKIREELNSILHEMLFLRVKPVYRDDGYVSPCYIANKSKSLPNLFIFDGSIPAEVKKSITKSCSDSNLDKIDREKTFIASKRFLEQTDLLFKVVGALSSESLSESTDHKNNLKPRVNPNKRRAISDIRPPTFFSHESNNGNTWYGADADHAISEYRKRCGNTPSDFKKSERPTVLRKIRNRFLSLSETKTVDVEKQIEPIKERVRKPSTYTAPSEEILESTSIADFIRALSVVTAPDLSKLEYSVLKKHSRVRHLSEAPQMERRSSIACDNLLVPKQNQGRRFSLKPVEEGMLCDTEKFKNTIRKKSMAFQADRRNSLLFESSIPPVKEHVPPDQEKSIQNAHKPQRSRKFSVRRILEKP